MPAPTVTAISPPTGITGGGTVLLIAGTNFTGASSVTIGAVSATFFAVVDDTSIYAIAPANPAGNVSIVVTTPSGTGTGAGLFTYTVPASPAYNVYLWDDCCHNWFSTNTGGIFRQGATPGGPSTPPPNDSGQDPNGVGTLLNEWSDGQMAINDADYLTLVGFDYDYGAHGTFGIIAVSPLAGQNKTYTLIDYEPGSPAFIPDPTTYAPATGGAISANAQIILAATNLSSAANWYPRLSINKGVTWSDVTAVGSPFVWYRACFGAGATVMYLIGALSDGTNSTPGSQIWKSTNTGTTWTRLASWDALQPILPSSGGGFYDEAQLRMRCSANGQTVVIMENSGQFYISKDGGATWTHTNFASFFGKTSSNLYADCGVTPDGGTVVISMEVTINMGFWPAVAVSTNGGTSFTDVSANLQYPASVGPPTGGAPGTIATGCTQCNVAPDGLGVVVTFLYNDTGITEPDGTQGYVSYVNISTNSGSSFTLCSFDADQYESGSALGVFTGIYITPFTVIPPPTPPFVPPPGGYIIERLDNRIWPTVENVWAVDCGFTLARPTPNADLFILPAP